MNVPYRYNSGEVQLHLARHSSWSKVMPSYTHTHLYQMQGQLRIKVRTEQPCPTDMVVSSPQYGNKGHLSGPAKSFHQVRWLQGCMTCTASKAGRACFTWSRGLQQSNISSENHLHAPFHTLLHHMRTASAEKWEYQCDLGASVPFTIPIHGGDCCSRDTTNPIVSRCWGNR